MSFKEFREVIDKENNIVHGSFLDNLESILDLGICPPSMLPKDKKPKRFFGNTDKNNAKTGTNMPYISTMVLKDINKYSFERFYLWSPFFHYFVIADHKDWGQKNGIPDAKKNGKPFFYQGSELTLYNQKITPEEIIGFVTYPDYLIKELSEDPHNGIIFKKEGRNIITSNEINAFLIENLKKRKMDKIIYNINGEKIN